MFASWRRDIDRERIDATDDELKGFRPAPLYRGRHTWRTVLFPGQDGQPDRWDHLPVVGLESAGRELVVFHRRVYAIQTSAEYTQKGMGHVRVAIAMVRRLPGAQ